MIKIKGITARTTLLAWTITLATLCIFIVVIVPAQKRNLKEGLESKAHGIAAALQGEVAGAADSKDYSSVVERAMQMLAGDPALQFLVITKNNGYSVMVEPNGWRIVPNLEPEWHPKARVATSTIGVVPRFGRRAFHYAVPFDYRGLEWGWIHVGLSPQSYDNGVKNVYRRTGELAVVCIVLSFLASLLYAKRFVGPILRLRAVVERVARGDLAARAEIHSNDEIEQLAHAFNDMADALLQRDRIVESVRFAAQMLQGTYDWNTVIDGILARLGQAANVSRVHLIEFRTMPDKAMVPRMRFEWTGSDIAPFLPSWEDRNPTYPGLQARCERLASGQLVIERRSELEAVPLLGPDPKPLSKIRAPIFVGDILWGALAMQDCHCDREWREVEQHTVRAVADIMGAAITRQRTQEALVEVNNELERRVAERTHELSDQKAALAEREQRLQTIVQTTQSGFWLVDTQGRILDVNDAFCAMTGYSRQELLQMRIPDLEANETAQDIDARIHRVAHAGVDSFETRNRRKDGQVIDVAVSIDFHNFDGGQFVCFGQDITERKRAEKALAERTRELSEQIVAKDRAHAELQEAQKRLMELSRLSGMAEVATGVLHNVGNVLNSINVSASILTDRLRTSRVTQLPDMAQMLVTHKESIRDFLTQDPRGVRILPYFAKLSDHLLQERDEMSAELKALLQHVGHIKEIVAMQQSYARTSGVLEKMPPQTLVADALHIARAGMNRHAIVLNQDLEPVPAIVTDRNKVLQILLNLLGNAKDAVKGAKTPSRQITVSLRPMDGEGVRFQVADNGVGIAPENLVRIFSHGFTTKKNGHGFGLHAGALAAKQLGGTLRVESAGLGQGAVFTLDLPLTGENGHEARSV